MAPRLDLVGRATDLTVIDEALAGAGRGSGGVILVEGEAGIGKSRLLEAAAERARAVGFEVAAGEGRELEQARPFGPLVQALGVVVRPDDSRRAGIARYLDPRAASALSAGESGRFVVQETIIDLFEDLASTAPLLLLVDDLQWADSASVATLAALCRRAPALPVLVVLAVRPVPHRTDELVDVAVSVGAQRLHLDPLDTAAVGELAGRVVDATPGPALLRLVEGARGNPFFVIELVRALREERAIDVDDDGVAEARITGMPPTLRQTILRRLRALSPTALELLRGAAVLGGEFDVDDLAALLDRPAVSLHADLVAAVESGLLEEAGPRLRVRHDLIREAVHADLPEAIRVSLHRRAATVLNERGQPAIVVASHLLAAGRSGADAVAVLRRAGAELEDRDPAGALAMLDDALAVDGIDGRERLDVLADRVPLLVALGRLGDAERAAREALRANRDAEVEARLRLGLAESQLAAGFATGAVEQLETVRASGVLDEEQQAVLLADTAWARLDVFDLEGSARDARSAADWARAHDAPPVLSSALAIQSRLAAYAADFERAVGLGEEAVRVAGDDRAVVRRTPRLFLGLALVNADRADDAVATLAEGRRRAEDAGVPWAVASYHNALILSGFHTGAWDDATAEAEAARALHAEAGTRAGYLQMESMLGLMWLHLAEYDRARDALTRAEADFAEPGHDAGGIIWLLWLQASLAELDGDPDEALRLLGAAFDFAQQLRVHSVKLWYGPELVRLALAAGDRDRATAVAGSVEEAAQPASTATARGAASLCGGLVTGDPGRLLAAVAAYRQTPRRPDLVRACEAAGVALVEHGRHDDAVDAFEEALAQCEEIGGVHDGRRIEARLRSLGVRKGARGARRRPGTGIESLTPTERTVLDLVGAGLRNAEIAERLYVSRRTVETHVGRLYAKLQVRGRVALAQVAASAATPEAARD